MCKTIRLSITTIAVITMLTFANTASAGEPFHPIVDSTFNFFRWIFWF